MTRKLFKTLKRRIVFEVLFGLFISVGVYVAHLNSSSLSDSPRLLLASTGFGIFVGVSAIFFRLSLMLTERFEFLVFACIALVAVLLSPNSLPDTVWIVLISAFWADIVTKVVYIFRGKKGSAYLYPKYSQNSMRE
jgi:hypothetical protein